MRFLGLEPVRKTDISYTGGVLRNRRSGSSLSITVAKSNFRKEWIQRNYWLALILTFSPLPFS